MNRYLKLVHMEISRFWKLYVALLVATLLMQCGGIIYSVRSYISNRKQNMEIELLTDAQYAIKYGASSFYRTLMDMSFWIIAPIALSIAALLFYTAFIWYREWMGKNSFIYRLLMIPTARRNIYFAKLTAILLLALGLVGFQLTILPIEKLIYDGMIPLGLSEPMSLLEIIRYYPVFVVLIPNHFTDFLLFYGVGLTFIILIFTAIMLERSYRMKGLLGGIVYLFLTVFILLSPLFIWGSQTKLYLYSMELIAIELTVILVIGLLSLWLSLYLLDKKVTV